MKHTFQASLSWDNKSYNSSANQSSKMFKNHQISIRDEHTLNISAAKTFKGDASLLNPEDMLLSSVMSCHMMSYLYVCEKHAIHLISYTDKAEAILETRNDGSGRIIEIHLYPIIKLEHIGDQALALSLHNDANNLCFIANSCNFPIYHHPQVII